MHRSPLHTIMLQSCYTCCTYATLRFMYTTEGTYRFTALAYVLCCFTDVLSRFLIVQDPLPCLHFSGRKINSTYNSYIMPWSGYFLTFSVINHIHEEYSQWFHLILFHFSEILIRQIGIGTAACMHQAKSFDSARFIWPEYIHLFLYVQFLLG